MDCAPAERGSPELVREQNALLQRNFIATTLDAIPVVLLVLNQHRQIVLANAQAERTTGRDRQDLVGLRPGEAFGCVHAYGEPAGCGTTEFCSRCGALRSILAGMEGKKSVQECSFLRRKEFGIEAVDLQVSSSPIQVEGNSFVMFCIQDQSDLKRRRTLERLFFHDMLNTAGGLKGLMDILRSEVPEALKPDADFIHSTLAHLVDELIGQKDLMAAENNELTPVFTTLRSTEVLQGAAKIGSSLAQARGKAISVAPGCADVEFISDVTLVKRVIGNMVKNALEASATGDSVLLACACENGRVTFAVNNSAVMEDDVRLRVFKRNFSTKGRGRGLGTYGMKLLGERYLGGEVGFTTLAGKGTTFTFSLPLAPEKACPDPGAPGQP
ncbi:PAS domain-containing sensor histidine kinase [Fundidesulfovibrio terrae]|uniref:PAS domain-containing sensor histidine kinase n=1 Tax=Fundidesulfovibrio terrae TaxID=2922866 RepID=UPI001FAF4618|nr:PAS domain-containing sensor histidine kinase [Fundidesulfovibrio terrae]